jgi:hypothetical protein
MQLRFIIALSSLSAIVLAAPLAGSQYFSSWHFPMSNTVFKLKRETELILGTKIQLPTPTMKNTMFEMPTSVNPTPTLNMKLDMPTSVNPTPTLNMKLDMPTSVNPTWTLNMKLDMPTRSKALAVI